MILYLDTSALVKLYVEELDSRRVRKSVSDAERVGTSRVTYAEARSALARLHRERRINMRRLRTAVEALKRDLTKLIHVELSPGVSLLAGDLAETHGLRGFDAIHLASAIELGRISNQRVEFMTFDARQKQAAAEEKLPVVK
jgi:predicted nucleic acid-binding protein